jgi:signal transduction histidine kinase
MTGSDRIRIPDRNRNRNRNHRVDFWEHPRARALDADRGGAAGAGPDDSVSLLRHDLCTPLNAILGFADLLAECEQLSARHRRYAANIFTAGTDLLRTVNALVDQARIEGGTC